MVSVAGSCGGMQRNGSMNIKPRAYNQIVELTAAGPSSGE